MAMEEILKRLHELKTAKVAIYNNSGKDWDKNYAHGAMLAYSAAIQIIENTMINKSNENSDLNIPVVMPRILHFVDENGATVDICASGVNVSLRKDGTFEYFISYGFAGRKELTPVYGA